MPSPDKNFDDLLANGKTFTVRGQKFHVLDLSPEDVFAEVDIPENGESPWDISDIQILRFVPEDEHDAWRALRSDKKAPVTIRQINDVFAWLWEDATGIPLPRPDLSAAGAGKIATSSSEKSR